MKGFCIGELSVYDLFSCLVYENCRIVCYVDRGHAAFERHSGQIVFSIDPLTVLVNIEPFLSILCNTAGALAESACIDISILTWDDNVATIRLAEQTVTVPGEVLVQLSFYSADAERLSAFTFRLFVEKNPYSDQEFESTDYYSVLSVYSSSVKYNTDTILP